MEIFTLAPADHPTDPATLEHSYKLWSTFKRDGGVIFVRSNMPETAGGQTWHIIAHKAGPFWLIERGNGFLAQGGALLSRYLISKRAKVRSEVPAYQGKVRRYKATGKVYSLPSILNGYKAVVSRDRLADERSKALKVPLADLLAAREERKKGGV